MVKTRFEVYKDKVGTYRWRLLANNGESVAIGGEAYASKNGAVNATKKLKDWSKTKDVVDIEKDKEVAKKEAEKAKAKKIKDVEKIKKDKESAKKLADKQKSKKTATPKSNKTSQNKTKNKKVETTKSVVIAKANTKVKPTIKSRASKKSKKSEIKDEDMHIVKREDKYDGLTVGEAIEMTDEDVPLM